jgi:hypothetical protein
MVGRMSFFIKKFFLLFFKKERGIFEYFQVEEEKKMEKNISKSSQKLV